MVNQPSFIIWFLTDSWQRHHCPWKSARNSWWHRLCAQVDTNRGSLSPGQQQFFHGHRCWEGMSAWWKKCKLLDYADDLPSYPKDDYLNQNDWNTHGHCVNPSESYSLSLRSNYTLKIWDPPASCQGLLFAGKLRRTWAEQQPGQA